jgi:hypothetical protein
VVDNLYHAVRREMERLPHSAGILRWFEQQPASHSAQRRLSAHLERLAHVDEAFGIAIHGLVHAAERERALCHIAGRPSSQRAGIETLTRDQTRIADNDGHHRAQPRRYASVTVVVGVRARLDDPERVRNAVACLRSLNDQDLDRQRYRLVVVEQDSEPRIDHMLRRLVDDYVFVYNSGPYNRAMGFNIGGLHCSHTSALCLIDSDMLAPVTFLRQGLEGLEAGWRALWPYEAVLYLDETSTQRAMQARFDRDADMLGEHYRGVLVREVHGGCVFLDAALYRSLGGHDEAFRGWGKEDEEFADRVSMVTTLRRQPGWLLHMNHEPAGDDRWSASNAAYLTSILRARHRWSQ